MSRIRKAKHISLPEGVKRTRKKLKPKEMHVISDHALVRYMKRVLGVDIETIRGSILTDEQKALIRELKTLSLPLGGGITAKVREGVVVTII